MTLLHRPAGARAMDRLPCLLLGFHRQGTRAVSIPALAPPARVEGCAAWVHVSERAPPLAGLGLWGEAPAPTRAPPTAARGRLRHTDLSEEPATAGGPN